MKIESNKHIVFVHLVSLHDIGRIRLQAVGSGTRLLLCTYFERELAKNRVQETVSNCTFLHACDSVLRTDDICSEL